MRFNLAVLIIPAILMLSGCVIVSKNRVFPKVDWYWSKDAINQRQDIIAEKQYEKSYETNKISK
jgi:glutamate dehydrogenase/leucine dehydrogenase